MVKDKDVVRDVAETGCIGFVGSDVTTEQCLEHVSIEALCNVGVLRYGLLARSAMADVVAMKLANQETLVVGTSYPVAAKAILGDGTTIGVERSGAIEGLPERFPWLDGVVELLESGNSAVTNELAIVVNNLRNVELMLVTRPRY